MKNPSELDVGTKVYFKIATGTVFQGHICDGSTKNSDQTIVKVNIDMDTHIRDDSLPDHLAPSEYQPENVFRDGYTIDADEQTYTLTKNNLVEILQ